MKEELPSSYMVGQELIEDEEKIDATISYYLLSNVFITKFEAQYNNYKIYGEYYGGGFIVAYERPISKKLFETFKKDKGVNFLYGYFDGILPIVNTEINNQKYLNGQILNRPISCFDINKIAISCKHTGETVNSVGTLIFGDFPKSKDLAVDNDHIFIREFTDAITSYLFNNYDDCIRKLITSFENFFILNTFKGTFNNKLEKLTSGQYCPPPWGKYMKILNSNMKFIYKLRNKITHDELRVRFDRNWSGICHSGIGTLSYLYQNSLNKVEVIQYILSLTQQFLLITNYTSGVNLDRLEEIYNNRSSHENNIVKSPADVDKYTFNGLRIPENIKSIVLDGLWGV